jgi:hypothetical protein
MARGVTGGRMTNIWSPSEPAVPEHVAPSAYLKKNWSDSWVYYPEYVPVRWTLASPNVDATAVELLHRYGTIKQPYAADYEVVQPTDIRGWWCAIAWGNLDTAAWEVYKISGVSDNIYGSDTAAQSGEQTFVGYGMAQLLRKVNISRSYWYTGSGSRSSIGWIPDMNLKSKAGLTTGNRSSLKGSIGSYLYSGDGNNWTHYDYLEYILKNFVQQTGGAVWTIGGQVDLLKSLETIVRFQECQNAHDMINLVVSAKYGIGWKIVATLTGFEVRVYSLQPYDIAFGGITIPKNTDRIDLSDATLNEHPLTKIVQTDDHLYDSVRILGERIVVVATLKYTAGSLEKKWSSTLETAYCAGAGSGYPASYNDEERKKMEWSTVFTEYGAPYAWDYQGGLAAPALDLTMTLIPSTVAERQNDVRKTLPWVPFKENVDYGQYPPLDFNPAGHEAALLPPMAWVQDPLKLKYVTAKEAGLNVAALPTEFGLKLKSHYNHRLAKNHWGTATPTHNFPYYDYETLMMTIAFHSDQRFCVGFDLPSDVKANDGSRLDVMIPELEYWYAVPGTIYGVNSDGSQDITSGVIRSDVSLAAFYAAGVIARYMNERIRGEIVYHTHPGWSSDFIGKVIYSYSDNGHTQHIGAVITAIEYTNPENGTPGMTVKIGGAR